MNRIIITLNPDTREVSADFEAEPSVEPLSIAEARKALGWTQQDLADRAHVSLVTVRNHERGIATNVELKIARRIARALRCTVDQLFPDEP